MKSPKDETVSIRTSKGIKSLLKAAAEREHRSIASMVEVLILEYAHQHGLEADENELPTAKARKVNDGAH